MARTCCDMKTTLIKCTAGTISYMDVDGLELVFHWMASCQYLKRSNE